MKKSTMWMLVLAGLAFGMLILTGCTAPTAHVRNAHGGTSCTSASQKPDTLDPHQRDQLRQQFGGL